MRKKEGKKACDLLRNQSRLIWEHGGYALKAICRKAPDILITTAKPQVRYRLVPSESRAPASLTASVSSHE